jgi:hypothetical protein
MDDARIETATLAQVDDRYYFAAECSACHHHVRLSLVKLRARLRDAFPVVDVRPRLRCRLCGSRRIVISFLTPNQRVGNLAQFFEIPAE